ncbi:MAG: MMPL family transporter [Deltaproteobacteria bacterium]|nr:MMPL family transporter [Deltaproteobacteria bacterium]
MLTLIFLFTTACAASVSQAVLASTVGEMFFGEAPAYLRYLEHIEQFGSDEVFAVAYQETDPLSPAAIERLSRIVAEIEGNPEVKKTTSLLNLDRVRGSDGALIVESFTDAALAAPETRHALVEEIQSDPILRRTLIGASKDSANVLIELTVDPNRTGEVGPFIVNKTIEAFARHGYPLEKIHRAGFPAIISEMLVQTRYSLETLLPLVMVVLTLTVTLLFRSALPVFLAMGVSSLSVLWSVGVAAAFDPHLSIFYGVIPPVVTVVAVSDVIHMWSAYLHELGNGRSKNEAILASAEDVGRACLLTSVTTFVGFVSISLIPTPVFQELGWVLGLGVAVALILAMTLVPIAANMGAEPSKKQVQMNNPVSSVVDGIVNASVAISTQRPWTVIAVFTVLGGLGLHTAAQHTIETNFLTRLRDDNVVRIDNVFFESEYAGTQSLDVFITAPEEGRMLDPDVIEGMAGFRSALEALPTVDHAVSYLDILERIHGALGGDGERPASRAAAAQELLLFELSDGSAIESVLNFDRSAAHMSLRATEHRMRGTYTLGEQAEKIGRTHLPSDLEIEASGMMALSGGWLDEIVNGQRNGVLVSIAAITLLMILGLRSLSVGLVSLIPNLLPLVATTALCGWVWDDIDSDTLVVLMMAIGIGVDDTIHFLMRYRIESARCDSTEEAISRTFQFAGRAIVMTTLILSIGFSPMMLSEYYSIAIVGSLLPFALLIAMMADLLLVPALAQVGALRYRNKK